MMELIYSIKIIISLRSYTVVKCHSDEKLFITNNCVKVTFFMNIKQFHAR